MLGGALNLARMSMHAEHIRNVDANLLLAPAHQAKMNFIRGTSIRIR